MEENSGLGRYVHYLASNYLTYGISQKTKSNQYKNYTSQKEKIKEKANAISSNVSDVNIQELQDALNSMKNINVDENSAIKRAQKNVENYLIEKFEDLQNIDFTTGKVSLKDELKGKIIGKAKNYKDIEDLINRVDRFEKILMQLKKEGKATKQDIKKVKKLKEYYNILSKYINNYKIEKGFISTENAETKKDLQEKRDILNNMIAEFAAYPAIALQQGTFFEAAIAQLPEVCENVVLAEIVGQNPELATIKASNFNKHSKIVQTMIGEILEKTTTSQGKVDIQLTMKNNKKLTLSAKNVNLENYHVSLVSGSPLLYMLQDVGENFLYHFFNIFAKHPGNIPAELIARRYSMAEDIRLILFYKALTGDVIGRNIVDFFIVNDSNTGQVKIYKIADLIETVSKDIRKLSGVQLNNKTLNEHTRLNNAWVGQKKVPDWKLAQARIGNLLLEAHKQKVSVTISTNILK